MGIRIIRKNRREAKEGKRRQRRGLKERDRPDRAGKTFLICLNERLL